MSEYKNIRKSITELRKGQKDFFNVAVDVYRYQYFNNPHFRSYIDYLGKDVHQLEAFADFVYLPIEHFKSKEIKTSLWQECAIFESSGTSGANTSKHFIKDLSWYYDLAVANFKSHFGSINEMAVIALLPSYLERSNSSLVAMVNHFINCTQSDASGFFLEDMAGLSEVLKKRSLKQNPTIVFGVSFALLDLAEKFPANYGGIKFIETGGMKGRRKEMTRAELHEVLSQAFQVDQLYSEYGMTELLSQAYRMGNKGFSPGSTMKVFVSELNDPFYFIQDRTGRINVIDLANIDSCSFIQTADLGKRDAMGNFEILGRIDHADLRGCNLMYIE